MTYTVFTSVAFFSIERQAKRNYQWAICTKFSPSGIYFWIRNSTSLKSDRE